MKIKLVVVDMDGTFLNDENKYNETQFNKLFKQLEANDIKFAVASGSQAQRLWSKFSNYLDKMFFISQNGSVIFAGDKLLGISPISVDDLHVILKKLSQYPHKSISQIIISGVKQTYIDQQTPDEVRDVIKEYYSDLAMVPDIFKVNQADVGEAITKVGVRFSNEITDVKQEIAEFRAALPAALASLNSGFNVELIGAKNVDKITGIKLIQEQFNIANDEIMTFGDNENDAEMLAMTPNSYAMANASEEVKKIAKHVAPSNNDEGVLKVLAKYLQDK